MSSSDNVKYSLKTKIILVIGIIITLMMAAISISILFQWRTLIIRNQIQNSRNLTKAFSLSVLDALILAENTDFFVEDQLIILLADFKKKAPGIKYIMVLDRERRVIAHDNLKFVNKVYNDSISTAVCKTNSLISSIYENDVYGWIVETVQPLQIAGKRWGVLRIGMDAEKMRREIINMLFILFFSTISLIVVSLLTLYFLVSRLTGSLRELVTMMDKIDIDSDEFHNKPARNDEIGFLMDHFETLEARLSQSRLQLINAQKQIYHAEKLASIGRLASGVAHEINNPLNGIKNCVYSITKDPDDMKQNAEYLELINEGLDNIELIVQKLLGFARQQSKLIGAVNINDCIIKVLQLLEYRMNQKQIKIIHKLDKNLPAIRADDHLMQEVLMNLILNSLDAVSAEGGQIEIHSGQSDADNIFIDIIDNGEGIAEKDLQLIFDPFYTTKDPGKGTGLGLSVSLGIVETHGGDITLKSSPGNGAAFTVKLPIKEKA